jgi:hypothetical protein
MSLLRTSPRGGGAGIRAGKLGRVRAVHNHRSHFGPVLTGSVHTRVAACARFSSLCVAAGWRAIAARAARARAPPHPLRTRNRSNPLRCFLPRCPRALLHLREHTPLPLHVSLRLTSVDSFRVPFRSRAPTTSPPLSSPPPRVSPPHGCPTLRPRAGLPLSRACNSPFAMSFGATRRPHAIPLILAARCWLLLVCVETLDVPFELAAVCGPISPCCRIHLPPKALFSLVRRMIAKLINCVAEKTNAHSDTIRSVAFSPDGTKIVSGSDDGTIKVRREPSKSPLLGQNRTLLACLAVKLEQLSEKTNAHSNQITSVAFSPDGTKIVSGSWDRTIKVWDSGAPEPSNRPSLAKTDACWLVWQTGWSC